MTSLEALCSRVQAQLQERTSNLSSAEQRAVDAEKLNSRLMDAVNALQSRLDDQV